MSDTMSRIIDKRAKVIGLLLVSMVILWLLTIATTEVHKFAPDSFYYAKQLPIYYWIGMIFGAIVFILLAYAPIEANKGYSIHLAFIIILILYLFATPSFIYANPQYLDTLGYADRIDVMIGEAHLTGYLYTLTHPVASLFFKAVCLTSGIDALTLARYYPILFSFLISILLYFVARKISIKYCLFAPVVYLSIAWLPDSMVPQSQALVLSVVFLALLITQFIGRIDIRTTLLMGVIMIAVALSHIQTPLIILASLFFTVFAYMLFRYFPLLSKFLRGSLGNIKVILMVLIFLGLVFLIHNVFIAGGFGLGKIGEYGEMAKSTITTPAPTPEAAPALTLVTDWTVTNPMPSHAVTFQIRLLHIFIILALALVSILLLVLRNEPKTTAAAFITSGLFLGCIFLEAFIVFIGGRDFVDRPLMFAFIPFSILVPIVLSIEKGNINLMDKAFKFLKVALLLFLLISLFLLPVTKHAPDPYVVPTESDMAVKEFIVQHPEAKSLIDFRYYGSPFVFSNYWYNFLSLKHQKGNEYIEEFNSVKLDKIYENPQSAIYLPINHVEMKVWELTGYRITHK